MNDTTPPAGDLPPTTTSAAAIRPEEWLRLVIENAREYAIFSTDLERRITGWNTGAERLLGHAESEVIGRTADIIFTPEDRAAGAPEREARQALAEGRAGDDRFHQRKDGSQFWASGAMMSMHDDAGRTVGLLKILRDQSEARRAQLALEQSQAELLQALRDKERANAALEAASVAKDQFLAVLSHELRTPLTPAVMAVQLLSRRTDLPPGAREALELIHRNIRIESQLIDDLLDLTRISRGTLEIVREPVDLHAVIRAAVEVCEPDMKAKGQRLVLAIDAPVPGVAGDGRRLQQVIWNLLKNASKFTPAAGDIRVATAETAAGVRITVSDSGMGIEAEALAHIFEAFVQGGTGVAREYGGLGLGLSISRATVEAHGGSLRAESPGRDQGATFIVELPRAAL